MQIDTAVILPPLITLLASNCGAHTRKWMEEHGKWVPELPQICISAEGCLPKLPQFKAEETSFKRVSEDSRVGMGLFPLHHLLTALFPES